MQRGKYAVRSFSFVKKKSDPLAEKIPMTLQQNSIKAKAVNTCSIYAVLSLFNRDDWKEIYNNQLKINKSSKDQPNNSEQIFLFLMQVTAT